MAACSTSGLSLEQLQVELHRKDTQLQEALKKLQQMQRPLRLLQPTEFARQLLDNPAWHRQLTGSKDRGRRQLPPITTVEVESVAALLAETRGLHEKKRPAQPGLVEEGRKRALAYLTQGHGDAWACASPWEAWGKVNRTHRASTPTRCTELVPQLTRPLWCAGACRHRLH